MSSLTILGDTSGSVALTAATVAGSTAITIAAQSGTLNVGGPCFSVYLNGLQTITNATATKINFNVKEFDTANAFDSTTNYRFQPTVAGYYQLSSAQVTNWSTLTRSIIWIYKNGSQYKRLGDIGVGAGNQVGGSCLVYLNGTTDYAEAWGYISGTGTIQFNGGDPQYTWFTGTFIRGA